ncbi:acylneuraminate cytidylyltransferase family protein [Scandinavium sp.]|uniref:acylneuraminate cytidylyltransferase family protein n=1 Tax=Scandinavium sp. TaxID=2830653 RepID=UPI00289635C8|nr:acylneuraminate cytidylyltransferase family protein [Scandinavium sp.]
MSLKVLAIIPARGGSKRLPGKNKKMLHGKPMITWTIEAAMNASGISTVYVSTDDPEIAELSRAAGALVPELRPAHLSQDETSTIDVVKYIYGKNPCYDAIAILQPTSPLRTSADIENAISLFIKNKASSVISITECEHKISWSNYLDNDLNLDGFLSQAYSDPDGRVGYRLNGAIYLFDAKKLDSDAFNFYDKNAYGYLMDRVSSIDIDYIEDFEYAEYLLQKKAKAQ